MIVKPSMTALLKKIPNKYSFVVGTAKRARQVSLGSPKLTDVKAGEARVISPSHFSNGLSRIMMVRTYDTTE